MTMMDIAEKVENVFHVALGAKDEYKAFHLDTAMLVGIKTDGDKVVDINAEVASNEDIYDLLADSDNARRVQGYDSVGLVTCGWAAPLPVNYDGESELGAPSQHPEKRRVRLMVSELRPVFLWDRLYIGGGNSHSIQQRDLTLMGDDVVIVPNSAGVAGGVRAWQL